MSVIIKKANGELVEFSEERLRRSLRNAGASPSEEDQVARYIASHITEGEETRSIFRKAFGELRRISKPLAGRYKLKKAILELGPTGFPFELFIAELFRRKGFDTDVSKKIMGKCVSHEVDVVGRKDGKTIMVECKFHNLQTIKCDVKIPLYVRSRFHDIAGNGSGLDLSQVWLVTNTRFTGDAMDYGTCAGLRLLSWDYPGKGSLKSLIDKHRLYPVTSLLTLTLAEKKRLIETGVVLAETVACDLSVLLKIGMPEDKARKVLFEAGTLCGHQVR